MTQDDDVNLEISPEEATFFYRTHQAQVAEAKAQINAVSSRELMLRTDLARAMGHMQGCGHPDKYLLDRYPEFAQLNPQKESN